MELSIIIVSYNTAALTKQCLESIFTDVGTHPLLKEQLEIIVVDNHSADASIATLQQLKKAAPIPLTILANPANTGFAAANNQAILQAKGENLLLLNSDTIVQPGALSQLVRTMKDPHTDKIGILAASLLNPDGSPQPQGGDLPSLVSLFVFAFMLDDLPLIGRWLPSHQHTGRRYQPTAGDQLQPKGWVAGTAMVIRSHLIPHIGVLDEQIFMYAEDLEYCWRAQRAGWLCAIEPRATITHFGSRSSSAAGALAGEFRSLRYVLDKHLPAWQHQLARCLLFQAVRTRMWIHALLSHTDLKLFYQSLLTQLHHTT